MIETHQPGSVLGRLGDQRSPSVSSRRLSADTGFGIGGGIELRFVADAARRISVFTRFDPHHPHPVGRAQVEVDRAPLLHPLGGDEGNHFGILVEPGFVGSGLTDDAPLSLFEEPTESQVEGGVRLHRSLRLGQRTHRPGQIEQVAGDDENTRSVPGVEGAGQLVADRQGGRCCLGGEKKVTDHHDATAQRDVNLVASDLGRKALGPIGRHPTVGTYPFPRLSVESHSPPIVEVRWR